MGNNPTPPEEIRPQIEKVETPRPSRVLVVQPQPSILNLFTTISRNESIVPPGITLVTSSNPEEAIHTLIESERNGIPIDRVVTELKFNNGIQRTEGLEISRFARGSELKHHPEVLIYAGSSQGLTREYLMKEVDFVEIMGTNPLGAIGGMLSKPLSQLREEVSL